MCPGDKSGSESSHSDSDEDALVAGDKYTIDSDEESSSSSDR